MIFQENVYKSSVNYITIYAIIADMWHEILFMDFRALESKLKSINKHELSSHVFRLYMYLLAERSAYFSFFFHLVVF